MEIKGITDVNSSFIVWIPRIELMLSGLVDEVWQIGSGETQDIDIY